MQLDRRLNLVAPIHREEGTIYVHSTPISKDVYQRYWRVMARAYAAILSENLTSFAGPQTAYFMLRDTAMEMRVWEGKDGVEIGLVAEIRRLTNVGMPGNNGWEAVPLEDVRTQKLIDDDHLTEVENLIVFFTLVSHVALMEDRKGIMGLVLVLWKAQTTFSNCTEFLASLPTSKPAEPTGAKVPPSPIPY